MKSFLKYLLATLVGIFISFIFLFIFLIIIVASSTSDKPAEIKANTILYLKLNEQIVERAADNPMNYLPGNFAAAREMGLNDIIDNIHKAKKDENIDGIYMELTAIPAGISTVKEIRNALQDFKESGKFIISYSEIYTQKAYYLASLSDKIYLNPAGDLAFTGLAASRLFFKGALDKLGVEVQIIRHGEYKSAVEPYMSKQMSDESREQTLTWVSSLWDQMLLEIAESREISIEDLNKYANGLTIKGAEEALEYNFVDGLKYKDEIINELKELTGTSDKKDLVVTTIRKYNKVPAKREYKGLAKDKIAVIYAHGTVVMGNMGEGYISSDRISKALRKARRDSSIKAIVFRINSGGGSALASDVIWREVDLASKVKPVVASFGDVAASGGYYIAAPADTIMAQPTTITGSIGVFAMIPNMGGFFDKKLGINSDVAKTNISADFGSLFRPLSISEKEVIRHGVEKVYDDFVTRVSDGRGLSWNEVDEIGQGRVWSGTNALDNGLIDLYGGLSDAIKIAAEMASLEKYRITYLPKLEDPFEEFLKMLSENAKIRLLKQDLGEQYKYLEQINNIRQMTGIQTRLPYYIEIN